MLRSLKGYLWMIRRFGLIRTYRYEKDRKAGFTIDYSEVFTAEELQKLETAGLAPWKEHREYIQWPDPPDERIEHGFGIDGDSG